MILKKKSIEEIKVKVPTLTTDKADYNFDFSRYEREEKDIQVLVSIHDRKKPRITTLKSKFSPSMFELEGLSYIKVNISEKSIKVAGYSQNIKDLWELYGCLNEYWAKIKDIYGSIIINEVDMMSQIIERKLIRCQKENSIDFSAHRMLLQLRDKIYMLAQRANLGLEVERVARGDMDKARKGIIE